MRAHYTIGLKTHLMLQAARPEVVLEVGAQNGGNTRQLLSAAEELGFRLITIDDNPCPKDLVDTEVEWIEGLSFLEIPKLEDESIHFCFIDTDHNSWTVTKEIKELKPKIGKDGVVIFHDTSVYHNTNGISGAYACSYSYPHEDIKSDPRGYGEAIEEELSNWSCIATTEVSCGAQAYRRPT